MLRLWLTNMLLIVTLATSLLGQQTVEKQVAIETVYRAFLGHVSFLQSTSANLSTASPDKATLGHYYGHLLALSPSEEIALAATASATNAAVKGLDDEAHAIVLSFRERVKITGIAGPPPEQLTILWQKRQAVIRQQVLALQQQLSPQSFRRLDRFVRHEFSANVKLLSAQSAQLAGTRRTQ